MLYERTISIAGDAAGIVNHLRDQFLARGFKLDQTSASGFSVTGPGMHSTHEDWLHGVSQAEIKIAGHQLSASARLGGARQMQLFIAIFPLALIAFLALTFYLAFPPRDFQRIGHVFLLMGMVWIPIIALWVPSIRRTTTQALDTLLENAQRLGGKP